MKSCCTSSVPATPCLFRSVSSPPSRVETQRKADWCALVWALYPESNQRTLEEMDMLFAADTPWVWHAEKTFAHLREQNPDMIHGSKRPVMDAERKGAMSSEHQEVKL